MPTGYTAGIEDGTITTFREFALICARAMGACVMQREEPLSNPPRHREPSSYELNRLAKAEQDLKELQAMSLEEAGRRSDEDHIKATEANQKYRDEYRRVKDRYMDMRKEVEKWIPPTKDHEGLKNFMLDQIDICTESLYFPDSPVRMPAQKWLDHKREKAARDIGYYLVEIEKEKQRCEDTNKWIDQLYASLGDTKTQSG